LVFSETDADVETIIKSFYERCLASRPEAVRMFIEEDFVSYSGARLAQDEKSILRCFEEGWEIPGSDHQRAGGFGDPVKAQECLNDLVRQRLITSLGGGENPSYELIHDLVASVAEKNRTGRQERFEKEQAERRAEAEKKAKDEAKARAQIERERAAALDVALDTAQKAKIEADNLRKRSDSLVGLITFVEKDLTAALESIGKGSLATEFKKGLAEYRKQYADVFPKIGSWEEQLKDVRSRGNRLKDTGDLSGALQLYLQAIDLTQKQLGRGGTDGSQAQMWLARFMRDQGDVLMAQGNLQSASQRFQEALDIDQRLAQTKPDNSDWQRDLSVSYARVGDVQSTQGDRASALKSYRDSLAIREKLAKQDPGNAGWQRDLSISYTKVGDVQSAQEDLPGALKSYRDSFAIFEILAQEDPGDARCQRDLSISYERIGDVQSAQGDLPGALKSYRDSLAIREKLAKQDPGNARWQRNLSVSYNKVGDVQSAQGDRASALKSYCDGLAISEKLAKLDPGNAGWQRDLSISYTKVGDVQSAQKDVAGALKSYRDDLAISEKLAKQDPGNAGWQGDLAFSYWRTAVTLARVESKAKDEARAMVEKGRDVLRQLKTHTGLTPQQENWLNDIESDLRAMQEKEWSKTLKKKTPKKR
jgi:tetratricopeptide (TPR) repeat protein